MENSKTNDSEIELINEFIFKACNLELTNIVEELESREYAAHSFQLDKKTVKFRIGKITPTKTGQFVTIWKRNEKGITCPYNITDNFDFFIIATRKEANFGLFIFPKDVLLENKIISNNEREGKRGIRVYPSWDITTNKQAIKTQHWQLHYFLDITQIEKIDVTKAKKLLNLEIN